MPMKTYGTALVLGMGASGEAAARLLLREGSAVTVVDRSESPALAARAAALEREGARVLTGAPGLPGGDFEACVLSPGIAAESPWVAEARARGMAIVPELDLGFSRCRCRVAAITGTNGKSTAVKLCADILRHGGLRAEPGANFGRPLSDLAPGSGALDWIVAEVSSFQLELAREFRPQVAVLLNIEPNHLDRHPDMAAYRGAKLNLFSRLQSADTGIVLDTLLDSVRAAVRTPNRWLGFGESPAAPYRYAEEGVTVRDGALRSRIDLRGTVFADRVRGVAAAAAAALTSSCGVSLDCVGAAARAFVPLAHRMQTLGSIRGVRFINDSKATTLTAMQAALDVLPGRVRLIAGGLLKEPDLAQAKELLVKRAVGVYLIGKAADRMRAAWGDAVACRQCGTLESAVDEAFRDAREGDVILLAPGCASFDQFKGYEERGERFIHAFESRREG